MGSEFGSSDFKKCTSALVSVRFIDPNWGNKSVATGTRQG